MSGKVVNRAELAAELAARRERGERIVFTNGCFDILHVGHARSLQRARALGDCLVVGVNSDESTRRLKGPQRPIVPEADRAELLAALRCVDLVTIFEETTPEVLLELVRPAIHVKGGDYTPENLPEADLVRRLGGEVVIVPLEAGRSTTDIVKRMEAGKGPAA
jgi:D-beta-D-heptose 7-phosphate kinase/D-beta-D-heptose 1-phosphate adenosyltransferase